mgnify:CR=1 FL=1
MATAYQLTQEERDTLNAAMEIIERVTAQKTSWQICVARYSECLFTFDVTYFDSAGGQHSWVRGQTLADKVQTAVALEGKVETDAEKLRLAQIERLKSQLAALTGEAA